MTGKLRSLLITSSLLTLLCLCAPGARADWFDDYFDGLKALEAGSNDKAISLLEKAVKSRSTPGDNVPTYGTNDIEYYPYYYLGVAYVMAGEKLLALKNLLTSKQYGELGDHSELVADREKWILSLSDEPTPPPPPPPPPPDRKGRNVVSIVDATGRMIGGYEGSQALLIGVSNYTVGWPDLESVEGELSEIENALVEHGFGVARVRNPGGEELKQAFEDFIKKYGYLKNHRLLFFFAGHGYTRKDCSKGYLVPSDAPDPRKDMTGFLQKALVMGQIVEMARRIEAKHALFLFDSCFSGTVFKARELPKTPRHINELTVKPVRQFITAGSANEVVPAKSVFVPSLIRALRGEADFTRDGYVTGTELGMYLHDKVLYYETGQTPQYGKILDPDLDEGDFVFQLPSTKVKHQTKKLQ